MCLMHGARTGLAGFSRWDAFSHLSATCYCLLRGCTLLCENHSFKLNPFGASVEGEMAIFAKPCLLCWSYNGAVEDELVEDLTILAEIPSSSQLLSVKHIRLDSFCLSDCCYFDLTCFHESRLFLKQSI